MAPITLSMPARLLLLAIDPADGGVLAKSPRRLRRALAYATIADDGGPAGRVGGRRALRSARTELAAAGLAERRGPRRRLHLVDRPYAARAFNDVRAYEPGCESHESDRVLFVLLAWSGVLRRRLPRGERRLALRRLRALVPPPHGDRQAELVGLGGLGAVAAFWTFDLYADTGLGFGGGGGGDGGGDGGAGAGDGDGGGGGGDGGGGGGGQ